MGNTFAKFFGPDLEGESQDDKQKGWCEIQSFNYGLTNSGYTHSGMGGSGGEVVFGDLGFNKDVDKATSTFLLRGAQGQHFERLEVVQYKAGGSERVPYLHLEFKKVFITSYQLSGADGAGVAMENITCSYAEVKQKYTEQTDEGFVGPASEFAFDVNKKVAA